MTTEDGRISNYLTDVEAFADLVPPAVEAQIVPDDVAIQKADYILKALQGAGLKFPYGFDREAALTLWAGRLAKFSLSVLEAAIAEWVGRPGTESPSVGDVENAAIFVVSESTREQQYEEARTREACPECDDVRWVRVYGPADEDGHRDHHMRPCPRCPEMQERSELYDRGHFDPEHQDKGGCPKCWKYMPSMRHKTKAKDGAR